MKQLTAPFVACCSFWALGLLYSTPLFAQRKDTTVFIQPIMIDEVVINASENGLNLKEFIERIKTDTTFYKAFRTMHLVTYNAENDIRIYEKKAMPSKHPWPVKPNRSIATAAER